MPEATPLLTGTVSATALGRLVGLSTRRLRELAESGVIPRERGRYRLPDAVAAYTAHLREIAAGRASTGDRGETLDLVHERAALARRQREAVELKLARDRGELVDAEAVKREFVGMVTTARNQLLAVPTKAKARVPHLSIGDIEILEDLVAEALAEVADGSAEVGHG